MSKTKYVQFSGKAHFVINIWPDKIDREYEDPNNGKGGNWNLRLKLNDDSVKLWNAIGPKAKLKDGNVATFRRNEFQVFKKEEGPRPLGPPEVVGVEAGTLIGNDSDITVTVEVYETQYNKRPLTAMRLLKVTVDNLIPYEKPAAVVAAEGAPPVH